MRWIIANFDWLCPLLCFTFCFLHSLFEVFRARSLNKKIAYLCDKCMLPVVEGEKHDCTEKRKFLLQSLSDKDITTLSAFVDSLIETVLNEVDKND